MTVYIRVPELESENGTDWHDERRGPVCNGCVFQESEADYDRHTLRVGSTSCIKHVWIENTEAARLAYITLKLEN